VFSILIHNQCSNFELISPTYFGHNTIWHIPPAQKVDANTIISASFGKRAIESDSMTALIYSLQRNESLKSNEDNISIEDTSTIHQLLIVWRVENSYKLCINVILIKYNDRITWDEDKLNKLYTIHCALNRDNHIIEDVWLLDDTTMLITTSKWGEESRTIEIAISEETKEDGSMGPLCAPASI
jgi:hypothetical protein